MTMPRTISFLTACLVFITGLIAGCGDEETPPCAPGSTGVIRGSILAAGQSVRTRVIAYRVASDPENPGYTLVQGFPDSTGNYSLEVPAGDYILGMDGFPCFSYYGHGMLVLHDQADTLSVGRGETVTANLATGELRIEITAPAELEGRQAHIRLESVGSDCRFTAAVGRLAGGDATFYAPNVLPGTYRIVLDLADLGTVWLPGTTSASEADTVTVLPGLEKIYRATLPQAAILRGTITGSWQELGQFPPRLSLTYTDIPGTFAVTQVNSVDGSFDFHIYGHMRAALFIQIDRTTRWYGGDTQQTATPIELEPGQTTELDLRESGVAGWLNIEPPPNNPTISISDEHGVIRARCVPDGPRGFFRMSNLTPGTYFLHIPAGPAWLDQWYDRADSLAVATPIEITDEGHVVWLNLDLEEGGRIEGQLFRDDGAPAYGVPLDLVGPTGTQAIRQGLSDGDGGGFTFAALPDGDYRIVAHPNEIDVPVWYPGVIDPQRAIVISIRNHAGVAGIYFDLP